jgi:adenine-specific DNA-methyltransferase
MSKLKMQTHNMADENFAALAKLFPNAVTETVSDNGTVIRAVDAEVLQQEINTHVIRGKDERYQFTWPDKKKSILLANTPIAATLRPCREESVNFDTTQNLYIEGDNLDVLKLLRETYLNSVKMIYIDPPYNTGNDFVYEDDFSENTEDFLFRDKQYDELGNKLVFNTDSNGRFHTDWLNMIMPRLRVVRDLLSEDGFIFISINDNEADNLRKVCDEVFGANNFIAHFIWQCRQNADSRSLDGVSNDHEFILCYRKQVGHRLRGKAIDIEKYKNPDNDPRGPWMSSPMDGLATAELRPNLHYTIVNPETRKSYNPNPANGWRFQRSTVEQLIKEKRVIWPKNDDSKPRFKRYLNELDNQFTGYSTILDIDFTLAGTKDLRSLMGMETVKFPKPVSLPKEFIIQSTNKDSIVLDFFSGSATTAHAVMQLNAEDGGKRQFIMVQLPELTDENSEAFKAGYKNICEIGKERIRRAGAKIKETSPLTTKDLDIGFRVLKLDSSNMQDVYYTSQEYFQLDISGLLDNIKDDRTPEDLLFQTLLELGIPLSSKLEQKHIEDKTIFYINGNDLIACFETVNDVIITRIAQSQPRYAVFRDLSFTTDSTLANVEQIFRTYSPTTIWRVL